jgi:hypothetical protein
MWAVTEYYPHAGAFFWIHFNVGTFLSSTKVPEQMDAELSAINSEANED